MRRHDRGRSGETTAVDAARVDAARDDHRDVPAKSQTAVHQWLSAEVLEDLKTVFTLDRDKSGKICAPELLAVLQQFQKKARTWRCRS